VLSCTEELSGGKTASCLRLSGHELEAARGQWQAEMEG
jgi:hypothetical protein